MSRQEEFQLAVPEHSHMLKIANAHSKAMMLYGEMHATHKRADYPSPETLASARALDSAGNKYVNIREGLMKRTPTKPAEKLKANSDFLGRTYNWEN